MEPFDQNASVVAPQPFRTQLIAWKDLPGLNKSLIIREGLSAPTRNQREAAARLLQLRITLDRPGPESDGGGS